MPGSFTSNRSGFWSARSVPSSNPTCPVSIDRPMRVPPFGIEVHALSSGQSATRYATVTKKVLTHPTPPTRFNSTVNHPRNESTMRKLFTLVAATLIASLAPTSANALCTIMDKPDDTSASAFAATFDAGTNAGELPSDEPTAMTDGEFFDGPELDAGEFFSSPDPTEWQLDLEAFQPPREGDLEQPDCAGINFRSMTSANFRYNLKVQTKKENNRMADYDAHHVMPKKFADFFQGKGLNIHNPRYGSWVQLNKHRREAYSYNLRWENWIDGHRTATRSEILAYARTVSARYGYRIHF